MAHGHDVHFLERLERLSTPQTELALSLYQDPLLIRALLEQLRLPDGATRVALSLADGARGPFVVVARDGHFERTGARSHGQPVYRRGNEYISPDVDRHNGGIWKKATGDAANLRNKTTRDGTFNEDLTEMVGP